MSRSKHTDPRSIRATRRLRHPFQRRSAGDLSRRRNDARRLKELGVSSKPDNRAEQPQSAEPRILIQMPAPGFWHPASKRDVLELLRAAGPAARYGLRTVELVRAHATARSALAFGRYEAPCRILLFEQPALPWRVPGALKREDVLRLKRAGAVITTEPGLRATLVDWPDDSLRRFMLEEVLLHELGHHVLQQHKGKRSARIARSRDHEAFAARFAARQRSLLRARKPQV